MSNFRPNINAVENRRTISKCADKLVNDPRIKTRIRQPRQTVSLGHNDAMKVFVEVTPLVPKNTRIIPSELGAALSTDPTKKHDYLSINGTRGTDIYIEAFPINQDYLFKIPPSLSLPNPPSTIKELILTPWRYAPPRGNLPTIRRFDKPHLWIEQNFREYAEDYFVPLPNKLANGGKNGDISTENFMKGDFKLANNNVYVVYGIPKQSKPSEYRDLPAALCKAYIILETTPSCWMRVCRSMQDPTTPRVTPITKLYCPEAVSNSGASYFTCRTLGECLCDRDMDGIARTDISCGCYQKYVDQNVLEPNPELERWLTENKKAKFVPDCTNTCTNLSYRPPEMEDCSVEMCDIDRQRFTSQISTNVKSKACGIDNNSLSSTSPASSLVDSDAGYVEGFSDQSWCDTTLFMIIITFITLLVIIILI